MSMAGLEALSVSAIVCTGPPLSPSRSPPVAPSTAAKTEPTEAALITPSLPTVSTPTPTMFARPGSEADNYGNGRRSYKALFGFLARGSLIARKPRKPVGVTFG